MRALSISLLLLAACSSELTAEVDPADEAFDTDALNASFDANKVIDDAEFFAPDLMDGDDVQRFLSRLPSGKASFLAATQITIDGRSARFADALAAEAQRVGVSPLVFLATLQKESGLVSVTGQPRASALSAAFGCGCPDGAACSVADAGLAKQLLCAAQVLGKNAGLAQQGKPTVSGWKLGTTKKDADGVTVTPASRGTAVLYTYTPLVRSNKLFHAVYTSYRARLGLSSPPTVTVDMARTPDLGKSPDLAGPADFANVWSDMGKSATPSPDLAPPPDLAEGDDLARPAADLGSPPDLAEPDDLAKPRPDLAEPERMPVPPSPPIHVGCSAAGAGQGGLPIVAALLVVAFLGRVRRRQCMTRS